MKTSTLGLLALLTICASPAMAQSQPQSQPQSWEGWTGTAGLAMGSAVLTCDLCDRARTLAPAGYLRIGRAIARGLVVSGEVDLWRKTEKFVVLAGDSTRAPGTSKYTIATLNAAAQWYPLPRAGFFVDGGLGIGRYHTFRHANGLPRFSEYSNALGYHAGAGYDVPISPRLAITPYAKVFGIAGAGISGVDGKSGANVVQAGVGLTWSMGS